MKKLSLFNILFIGAIILPFIPILLTIMSGNISFWYDPARDSLQALNNFHKMSLLGPTSGIPGVFYGPYWIWFLQGAMIFSKDPKMITLLVSALPYFIVFPFTLLLYKRFFNKWSIFTMWIIFVLGNATVYGKSLWNPYPAPLFYLFTAFLFATNDYLSRNKRMLIRLAVTGFMVGLISNVHLSFGLGIIAGSILFLLLLHVLFIIFSHERLQTFMLALRNTFLFFIGFLITYTPFLLFEVKHQFLQTKAFSHAVIESVFYHHPVVHQTGFSKDLIVKFFLFTFSSMFHLPDFFAYIIIGIFILLAIYFIKTKQLGFTPGDREKTQLFLFLLSSLCGLITLYLLTSNPVWNYHFIGVDVVALLVVGFFINQNTILRKIALVWISLIVLVSIPASIKAVQGIHFNDYTVASLATKEHVFDVIQKESGNKPFMMFAYSPSLYVFDYDYLGQWKLGKSVYYQPTIISPDIDQAFIILPKEKASIQEDFIHYVTDEKFFSTAKIIPIGVDITIIKRVRKGNL